MSDTTKWQNNTYVLLSDLRDDHEIALVENSLRDSEFYVREFYFDLLYMEDCIGVIDGSAGLWESIDTEGGTPITRTQALKLAGVEL